MSWFSDKVSVEIWGGPPFRFPFTRESFLEDVRWNKMQSFVMLNTADAMIGFGQTYEKEKRGHLARLVVSPKLRGEGHGKELVELLIEKARECCSCSEFSLYVLRDNIVASRCYAKVGFEDAPYPRGDDYYSSQKFMIRATIEDGLK